MAENYPRITQEMLADVTHILVETMSNDAYLENASYSPILRNKIRENAQKIHLGFSRGKLGVAHSPEQILELKNELKAELAPQVEVALRLQLESSLRPEIESKLRKKLESEIRKELEAELRENLSPQLAEKIESTIESKVEKQLRLTLESKVRAELKQELKADVQEKLERELHSSVIAKLESSLTGTVELKLRNHLEAKLRPEIIEDLKDKIEPVMRSAIHSRLTSEMAPHIRAELEQKLGDEIGAKILKSTHAKLEAQTAVAEKILNAPRRMTAAEAQKEKKLQEAKEKLDNEKRMAEEEKEILLQFESLSKDLTSRPKEYKDDFGILVRLEKTLRSIERLSTYGATDQVKLTATTRFMDFQDKEIEVLERLLNVEKVHKIEALTNRFFTELKNHPDFKTIAERYIMLLEGLV